MGRDELDSFCGEQHDAASKVLGGWYVVSEGKLRIFDDAAKETREVNKDEIENLRTLLIAEAKNPTEFLRKCHSREIKKILVLYFILNYGSSMQESKYVEIRRSISNVGRFICQTDGTLRELDEDDYLKAFFDSLHI